MPIRPANENQRAAISVTAMARLCGLSRTHFNLLIRTGVMPQPLYSLRNRRPFYDAEHQQICLKVRETNIGADGRYVVFYDRRSVSPPPSNPPARTSRRAAPPRTEAHAELVDGLRALGMTDATTADVVTALAACYPTGHDGIDEGEVLRGLWRHLRRINAER